MKTNTYILIVLVYSLLLGLPVVFVPTMSSDYFGQSSPTINVVRQLDGLIIQSKQQ